MKITITTQIASGNLGPGWADDNAAAHALADYTEATWRGDLAPYVAEGHDVTISVEVLKNTSGCTRDVEVYIEPWTAPEATDLRTAVEDDLTDEEVIWQAFCTSDEAEQYLI